MGKQQDPDFHKSIISMLWVCGGVDANISSTRNNFKKQLCQKHRKGALPGDDRNALGEFPKRNTSETSHVNPIPSFFLIVPLPRLDGRWRTGRREGGGEQRGGGRGRGVGGVGWSGLGKWWVGGLVWEGRQEGRRRVTDKGDGDDEYRRVNRGREGKKERERQRDRERERTPQLLTRSR